jgi:hypothetical protein
MRLGKARSEPSVGLACHLRWVTYEKAAHLRPARHTPKVGAGCGKAARPVLCGGRIAICVPTAIRISLRNDRVDGLPSRVTSLGRLASSAGLGAMFVFPARERSPEFPDADLCGCAPGGLGARTAPACRGASGSASDEGSAGDGAFWR